MSALKRLHSQERKTIARALVMLLVSTLVWTLMGSAASAQTSKDAAFLRAAKEEVTAGIAALAGTQLEVNALGISMVETIFADGEITVAMVARVKDTCATLTRAAKKGQKAVRAEATASGRRIGRAAKAYLEDVEANENYSTADQYSIGVVVGRIDGVLFKLGMQAYCPQHGKHVSRMSRAWLNAVVRGS